MNNNFDLPKLNNEAINNLNEQQPVIQEQKEAPLINDNKEEKYEASLKGLFKYLTTQDTKELLMVLFRVIIIALIVLACYFLPVSLLAEFGLSVLDLLNIRTETVINIWKFICYGLLALVGIYVFYRLIVSRYQKLVVKKGE